jgi:NAD dependent epimerase/dehydratase
VTGAEGFIGSHLVQALVAAGSRVRAMVLYNSFNSWGWLDTLSADVMDQVEVVLGDIRDPRSVVEFSKDAECLYHLAALIAIPYSYRAPASYVETNVRGTLNVLEAARLLEIPRVVHTSTSEVYGTARAVPIDETHPLQAQSPYSGSKIGADKMVESYHLSFGVPVVTLRPFNTYGPRQSARAVIPTVISQIAAQRRRIQLGAVDPTRDFMFVTDTAAALRAVGEAPAEKVVGRVLNAGTGSEVSIGRVVELIGELMGGPVEIDQTEERTRPATSEVMRLVCDASQLRRATGWRPTVPLEAGLSRTVAWFSDPANLARYKPEMFNL